MCAPRVTRHTSIRYSSSCHTRVDTVHRYSSLLQWSVPLGQQGHVAMVGRIPGFWHIPKEKSHRAKCKGTLGAITSGVGHFQMHILSNILLTLCSGTGKPLSGSGWDFSVLLEYERRYVLQLWTMPKLQHVQLCHASNGFVSKKRMDRTLVESILHKTHWL